MNKQWEQLTYKELVAECTRMFLDGIVSGQKLGSIVSQVVERVAFWASKQEKFNG